MPLPVSDDPVTNQGRLYVSPSLPVGDGGLPIQQLIAPEVPTTDYTDANGNGVAARIINRLLGTGGEERYKTWPEKLLRDALSAPHDVYKEGALPPGLRREDFTDKPIPSGLTSATGPESKLIGQALDVSALAGTGGLAGVGEGGAATLGSSPFLRPALKYEGKIYKAPMGGQHMDAIPKDLQPEFTRQAMSGEDISNFNFGFMNHKGQFLDREKALKYAIDEGLLSPHDAKYGALTSTLMADSSKEASVINTLSDVQKQNFLDRSIPVIRNKENPDNIVKGYRGLTHEDIIDKLKNETTKNKKYSSWDQGFLDPVEKKYYFRNSGYDGNDIHSLDLMSKIQLQRHMEKLDLLGKDNAR